MLICSMPGCQTTAGCICNRGTVATIADLSARLAASEARAEAAEKERSDGWLYLNPDTGVEWSKSHPVESGEVPDAENVREATATELQCELTFAWAEIVEERRKLGLAITRAEKADAALAEARKALIWIAHTFTENSHGDMRCLPASDYQRVAREALATLTTAAPGDGT